jgi:hypothetical protein
MPQSNLPSTQLSRSQRFGFPEKAAGAIEHNAPANSHGKALLDTIAAATYWLQGI